MFFSFFQYILPKLIKNHREYFDDLKQLASKIKYELCLKKIFVLVTRRTLIVCLRIGRTFGLCSDLTEYEFIRQGITSENEQVRIFNFCYFFLN